MSKRENKSFRFQVKAVDDEQGLIEAYGSVFDVVDQGDDVVKPDAFKRTIQNAKSRVQAGKTKFLAMMLWQHDANQPIGGWYDLKEDAHGLLCKGQIVLTTQLGRECYELIKAGVINEFSIGYDIPSGGAFYDKSTGYRNLTEIRLWEVSPVTFAMNEEALLTSVKAASGKTDWPLGDRNAAWDNGAAHKRIVEKFTDADGNIDFGKMKQVHFWYDSSAPDELTSYKLLFCDVVSDEVKAMPRGIFACAGSHGVEAADIPEADVDGVKSKIEIYYKRMAKEFNDDSIQISWNDDKKSRGKHMQKKTLLEHYNEEMAEDLLEDWQDVFICALTCAVLDALKIGDQPEQDIAQALDDFKTLVLSKFVAQAVEVNLSQYLTDNAYSSADYTMQNGADSPYYGFMSSRRALARKARKAGRAISTVNGDKIQDHLDKMYSMADDHDVYTKSMVKAIRTAADDLATVLQGSESAYGSDPGTPDEGRQEGKAASSRRETRSTQARSSQEDTVQEEDIAAVLRNLKTLKVS